MAGTPRTPSTPHAPAPRGKALVPGTVLGDRYRVHSLLGRGGMGSVYRVEDLRVGQEVALKIVDCGASDGALGPLLNEVRTARRISHPNVCRVYDIGDVDGCAFVSMEYVDGEDLAASLRRIGRFAGDKATQIARQLCAGLHAAHERGVLHRDLKPANVMLDAEGNVRITDFGIAAAMESVVDQRQISGTPAYMAPEQFTGTPPTVQSDLYSMGLVLYELYTGKPLFKANSMTSLLRAHRQPIRPPAELVPDIPPTVEQAILHCLRHDPEQRPASALALLAELGGDPLAEALAAGQTPSPELIAAAGGRGSTSKGRGALVVALLVAAVAALFFVDTGVRLFARSRLPRAAAALADRAAETLAKLGHPVQSEQRSGFALDRDYLAALSRAGTHAEEWNRHLREDRPAALSFWLRRAPTRLDPANIKGRVRYEDPALAQPGEVRARFDPDGTLLALQALPSGAAASDAAVPDAGPLLAAAGFDQAQLRATAPTRLPLGFADTRLAFVGPRADAPGRDMYVEAAFYGGIPVELSVSEDGRREFGSATSPHTWRFAARGVLVLAAAFLALQSLRRRRGDARGALTLGSVMFAMVMGFTLLGGGTLDGTAVVDLLVRGTMHGMIVGGELALFYFALEPHVRRQWPQTLIAWSRALAGRLGDSLVGLHTLFGLALGAVVALFASLAVLLPRWFGDPEPLGALLHPAAVDALSGSAAALAALLEIAVDALRQGMAFFTALAVWKLVLQRPWAAGVANAGIWTVVWAPSFVGFWTPGMLVTAALAALLTVLAVRAGLLALLVGFVTFAVLTSFPYPQPGAWYADTAVLPLLALAVAAVLSWRTATRALA